MNDLSSSSTLDEWFSSMGRAVTRGVIALVVVGIFIGLVVGVVVGAGVAYIGM